MSEAGVWHEYSPLPSGKSGCRSTAVSARSFHLANINFYIERKVEENWTAGQEHKGRTCLL